MMRDWMRGAGIAAVTAILLVGCIDESDSKLPPPASASAAGATSASANQGPTTVTAGLSEWAIALSRDTIPQGTVSFEVKNNGTEDHAFEVEGSGQEWKTDPIKPGESVTLSMALNAGSYDVYCPLASGGEAHADRGMKTTVTIQ